MNQFKYMAWVWYALAWGQLYAGVALHSWVNVALAALNFTIFTVMPRESKR